MNASIRICKTYEERLDVYRLRYNVYIVEMGRKQKYADHERKTIEEPIDNYSIIFSANKNGTCIGTIRLTIKEQHPLECEEFYGLENYIHYRDHEIAEVGKFLFLKEYRSTKYILDLLLYAYRWAFAKGIKVVFFNSNPHLLKLYTKVGCKICGPYFLHPDLKEMVAPLVFVVDDLSYLMSIGSPFYKYNCDFFNLSIGDYKPSVLDANTAIYKNP